MELLPPLTQRDAAWATVAGKFIAVPFTTTSCSPDVAVEPRSRVASLVQAASGTAR